jgi:hypothetical protein
MERWLTTLRDLLPGLLSTLDSPNGQVIRYPLIAFYSATAVALLFALLWAEANGIGGGFVGTLKV